MSDVSGFAPEPPPLPNRQPKIRVSESGLVPLHGIIEMSLSWGLLSVAVFRMMHPNTIFPNISYLLRRARETESQTQLKVRRRQMHITNVVAV